MESTDPREGGIERENQTMDVEVTLKKSGRVVGSETVTNPQVGDITAAAGRLFEQARRARPGEPLWDAQVDVRGV